MRPNPIHEPSRQPALWPALGWFVGVFAVLLVTLDDYAIVWDEGQYLTLESEMREWFARLASPGAPDGGMQAFSRASVLRYWRFSREQPNGHPPFWAIVSNAGWFVSHRWLDPLAAHRVGSATLFAIALAVMFRWLQRHWGIAAGFTASASLILMPRVFVHAHLNTTDATLAALWLLSVVAFDRAHVAFARQTSSPPPGSTAVPVAPSTDAATCRIPPRVPGAWQAWSWSVLLGILMGWTADTKLTGWFVPLPLVLWATLRRDRSAWKALLVAGPVCVVTMILFNPPWWHDPAAGAVLFLRENLGRRTNTLITTMFFGEVYDFGLPWYNALVWTGVTVPVGILALAALGLLRSMISLFRDSLASLIMLNWMTVMVLRSLPNIPGHDGERQLMASFPFLACLAGFGVAGMHDALARRTSAALYGPRLVTACVIAVALGTAAVPLVRYHPVQLSYYNELIGGLAGAERAGLEPTYFWDALTEDVLDWLNSHSADDDAVLFCNVPESFQYLRRWHKLRVRLLPHEWGQPQWYVLQNRPGLFRPADRWLIQNVRPAQVRTQDGVSLIWIFTLDEHERAIRESAGRTPAAAGGSDE